jgi:hypothetical protein
LAYALVGTAGVVTNSGSPVWGTGESRTANNLLILWAANNNTSTVPATPSGWTIFISTGAITPAIAIFWRIATGSDAAPVIAAGATWTQLTEWSGNNSTSPTDQSGSSVASTTTPIVANCGAVDETLGSLIITVFDALYSTAATKTTTPTLNNGATATDLGNNDSLSSTFHYRASYGITTGKSVADQNSVAYTTTKITSACLLIATFKLASIVTANPEPIRVMGQAIKTASLWCMGLPEGWKSHKGSRLLIPQGI